MADIYQFGQPGEHKGCPTLELIYNGEIVAVVLFRSGAREFEAEILDALNSGAIQHNGDDNDSGEFTLVLSNDSKSAYIDRNGRPFLSVRPLEEGFDLARFAAAALTHELNAASPEDAQAYGPTGWLYNMD